MKVVALFTAVLVHLFLAPSNVLASEIPAENAMCLEPAANDLLGYLSKEDSSWDYHIIRNSKGLPEALKDTSGDGAHYELATVFQDQAVEEITFASQDSDSLVYAIYEINSGSCKLVDLGMGQNDHD